MAILLLVINMTEVLSRYTAELRDNSCAKKISVPVIYSDDYLSNEMLDLNLARLCCTLCCASYDEESIKSMFRKCDFTEVRSYYYQTPEENSASICVARRGNNQFIVIKGTEGDEWYNNFRTGVADIHQGYLETIETIMPVLNEYINSEYNLLITGHSRGGAIANLLSSQLIKKGRKGVFCYTFASPNVTTRDDVYSKKYRNIHNFIYEDDFVTHCPLYEWGYNRYGNTIMFRNGEVNYRRLKKLYNEMTGLNFLSYKDCNRDVESFTDTVLRLAQNIDEYYNKGYLVDEDYMTLYDYFQTICDLLTNKDSFESGITLLATKLSEFAPITDLLSSGIEVTDLINQHSANNSCAMFAHSPLTYLCMLNTQKIKAV